MSSIILPDWVRAGMKRDEEKAKKALRKLFDDWVQEFKTDWDIFNTSNYRKYVGYYPLCMGFYPNEYVAKGMMDCLNGCHCRLDGPVS